jgi:hypothetical protein
MGFGMEIRFIGHFNTQLVTALYKSLTCLHNAADIPLFPGKRSRRLATISHQPPTFLTAISGLSIGYSRAEQ